MKKVIDSFEGEYAFLSNFYPSKIYDFEGNEYPTVDHYFQAMKTMNPWERKKIAAAPTPGKAKQMGRRVNLRHPRRGRLCICIGKPLRRTRRGPWL